MYPFWIDDCDKDLLINSRVYNTSINEWGKMMAISNQFFHKNILEGIGFLCTDNIRNNNGAGYDFKMNGLKFQSKLRQVQGLSWHSRQVTLETTRRKCEKNIGRDGTGHVSYDHNEFDYLLVTLVLVDKHDISKSRNDFCNWHFSLIPMKSLITDKGVCNTNVSGKLLKQYELHTNSKEELYEGVCHIINLEPEINVWIYLSSFYYLNTFKED